MSISSCYIAQGLFSWSTWFHKAKFNYLIYCLISCFDIIHFPLSFPPHIIFFLSCFGNYKSNVAIWFFQLCPLIIFSSCLPVYSFFNCHNLLVYPTIYGEKIREVATLSRLQHQHVVRYYQVQSLLFCAQICLIFKLMFLVSDFYFVLFLH